MFRLTLFFIFFFNLNCEFEPDIPMSRYKHDDLKLDTSKSLYENIQNLLSQIKKTKRGLNKYTIINGIKSQLDIDETAANKYEDKLLIKEIEGQDIGIQEIKSAKNFLKLFISKALEKIANDILNNDNASLENLCKLIDLFSSSGKIDIANFKVLFLDNNYTILKLLQRKDIDPAPTNEFCSYISSMKIGDRLEFLDFIFGIFLSLIEKEKRISNAYNYEISMFTFDGNEETEDIHKYSYKSSTNLFSNRMKQNYETETAKSTSAFLQTLFPDTQKTSLFRGSISSQNQLILNQHIIKSDIYHDTLKNLDSTEAYEALNLIGKGCFFYSFLSSWLYDHNFDKLGKTKFYSTDFYNELHDWYIKAQNELDYKNIFGQLVFNQKYDDLKDDNDKEIIKKFESFGKYILTNYVLTDVGLLPQNIEKSMSNLKMKCMSYDNFDDALDKMNEIFDQNKSVIILKYTANTLHYSTICRNESGEICEIDTNSTAIVLDKNQLENEMKYKDDCISRAIKMENSDNQDLFKELENLFKIFCGDSFDYHDRLKVCFKEFLQGKTGGVSNNSTGVKYCFLYREN